MTQAIKEYISEQQLEKDFISGMEYWICYHDDYGFDESEICSFNTFQELVEFVEAVGGGVKVEIVELEEALSLWLEMEDVSELWVVDQHWERKGLRLC